MYLNVFVLSYKRKSISGLKCVCVYVCVCGGAFLRTHNIHKSHVYHVMMDECLLMNSNSANSGSKAESKDLEPEISVASSCISRSKGKHYSIFLAFKLHKWKEKTDWSIHLTLKEHLVENTRSINICDASWNRFLTCILEGKWSQHHFSYCLNTLEEEMNKKIDSRKYWQLRYIRKLKRHGIV